MNGPAKAVRTGIVYGLCAYLWWGAIPIYFKMLSKVGPTAVVAHRILWSLLLLAVLLSVRKRWPAFRAALTDRKVLPLLMATALLISCNWLVYIWAVLNDQVMAASLGYYLNPLVNVLLGVLLLKERLSRGQIFAIVLAAAGVAVLAVQAAGALWISLALAISFSLYGLLRKVIPAEAVEGLSVETLLLAPVALGWLLWLEIQGHASFGTDRGTDLLLVLSGAVTAIPLLLFNAAAKRLPYSTLGILQYVSPSIQLLLAVLLFGEPFTTKHMICFALIWAALLLFAGEGLRSSRAAAREEAAAGL